MDGDNLDQHLSQMATAWTVLARAHERGDTPALESRAAILERYGRAIHRYLLGATRDPELADDLHQEFALKFLRGGFGHADPRKGRFRDYLKTSLYHAVNRARSSGRELPLEADVAEPIDSGAPVEEDAAFREIWRQELFSRAWDALRQQESHIGQPVYTVLRFRADHPEMASAQAAEALAKQTGKPVSAEWVRKWVQRARRDFARSLADDIARSLGDPTPDELEEELLELGLRDQCREALESRRRLRNVD
jgi:RNA polymerase sigma-70 factor (ECF subfamily)